MNAVTIGGVTVGLAILIYYVVLWWPGRKALQTAPLPHLSRLAPFLAAWAYGVLAVLTVGGLVGWIADTTLWVSSWLGDVALVWGVGGQAGQAAGGATYQPLTQTGGAVVLLLTVAVIAGVKKARCGRDLKLGAWCGICLGTSAGIAGFAAVPLAEAVNWTGATVFGVIV
ncbi:hypothetical protein E3E14_25220 [Streptomyces sp. ICN441]|uniref:hypothetical protein n=1 Tax=Streptomyces sp. ICN441 TaxID=2558286 RepID=UPI00106D60F7|nr:hypothetical protein [Streptomyces sp. ICN441]TFE42488.1 hypothetical protein E3E14_25220 [Streptomyces sp. ICN441]